MPLDEKKLRSELKSKDKEIAELKALLAAAETEIKELNDFSGFEKPKPGILESRALNAGIKAVLFLLLCAVIVGIGIYPWLNRNAFFSGAGGESLTAGETAANDTVEEPAAEPQPAETAATTTPDTAATGTPRRFRVKRIEVVSDLGWLNVRNQPNVQDSEVIKQINSGERYEWTEKTDNNWYKIVLDESGATGYVSGEYVEEVE